MTGNELMEMIRANGWGETDLFLALNGKIGELKTVEPMFPKLNNTNDVILTDGKDVEQDEEFWKAYYGAYIDIISEEEADRDYHAGNPTFYILYCDGTEGMVNDMPENEWEQLKNIGVMFGYEN